jgi:hypothetical protein
MHSNGALVEAGKLHGGEFVKLTAEFNVSF